MENRFEGKVVIVTGAGSGIGEAAARGFAAEGATVVLTDTVAEKIIDTAAALPGGRGTAVVADSANWDDVRKLVEDTVAAHGHLDILVNNAGTLTQGPVEETDIDEWHRVINTDLSGVFYGTKAAMPHLIESRGCIVNTSSVSGMAADWNMSPYNAAKGGVNNFTRAVALDHGKDGVRVNAVAPGLIWTDLVEDKKDDEEQKAKFAERIALGRAGQPDEVADAILFLASDAARFITGVILPVDGGTTASNGQPQQA